MISQQVANIMVKYGMNKINNDKFNANDFVNTTIALNNLLEYDPEAINKLSVMIRRINRILLINHFL